MNKQNETKVETKNQTVEIDAIGAIELDDALLNAEVKGAGPDDISSTTTAGWICNPSICC